MSAALGLTDKESKASALNELEMIFFSLRRLGSSEPVGGGLACAKTKRGKHKNRNIRSTLNCFGKGIDFENNSCLGFKRFFVNLALNITPKSVQLPIALSADRQATLLIFRIFLGLMEMHALRLATRFGWLYAIVVFVYELSPIRKTK